MKKGILTHEFPAEKFSIIFSFERDDPPSYKPDPRARKIPIRSGQDGTLKSKLESKSYEEEKPKFSEEFLKNAPMPTPKIVNQDKRNSNKRQAPPLPIVSKGT